MFLICEYDINFFYEIQVFLHLFCVSRKVYLICDERLNILSNFHCFKFLNTERKTTA